MAAASELVTLAAGLTALGDAASRYRSQIVIEAALARALKLKLEGNMGSLEWDTVLAAITSAEEAASLNVALIGKLSANAIEPAAMVAAAQRLHALRDSMLAAAVAAGGLPPLPTK